MRFYKILLLGLSIIFFMNQSSTAGTKQKVLPGAACLHEYLPLLKNKKVGLLVNQTSIVADQHLLDLLLEKNVNVKTIFVPEHGFRGTADAGAHIKNGVDTKTGLPIVSLYGNNKKPKAAYLQNIDVIVFDLQDVGTRFYTYISTLEYMMEACAEEGKSIIVLDRPNPNGHYIDGPVLEKAHTSFVGMQQIPVVYGMTIGEYANMLKGENLFRDADKLHLTVIKSKNYDHTILYKLPVPPSPNLREMNAIYLYPSLCFFEGTAISVGRGTTQPFQQWGHPSLSGVFSYYFIPESTQGANNPKHKGKKCYGEKLESVWVNKESAGKDSLDLSYLIKAYQAYPQKEEFFNSFFEKLAGTKMLRQQIIEGKTAEAIRASWKTDIDRFKKIRKKYLLYKDFE